MINVKLSVFLFIALNMSFTSCQKEEVVKKKITELNSHNKTSTNSISWDVADADFNSELLGWIELEDGLNNSEALKYELVIVGSSDDFIFTVNEYSDTVDPAPNYAIVCSGSGVLFVNCCKNWFEDNPDGCLSIKTDGDGNYTADDSGC